MEEAGKENPVWDGHKRKAKDMTWCNDLNERAHLQIISSPQENSVINSKTDDVKTLTCPSCGHTIQLQDQVYMISSKYVLEYKITINKHVLMA